MKSLKEYLLKENNGIPMCGTVAYDYNGEEWNVEAIAYADGTAVDGCKDLDELIKKFDESGSMKEELDNCDSSTLIAGCISEDYGKAAWVWGVEGVCYENKR